ncbi:hypothetical protein J2T17_004371 [Paenibacillus mucilaginosus]|uniref:hypothetical protein n=1 Tax=Paenibacillus mucilaginosus TaxID=61624 RepID=UPI003D21238D
MVNKIILICLYTVPLLFTVYLMYLLRVALMPGRLSIFTQMRHYFDARKGDVIEYYRNNDMRHRFEESGLITLGITPTKYRLGRDGLFIFFVAVINVRYLLYMDGPYPFAVLIFIGALYAGFQLKENYPIEYILKAFQKSYERKKNAEIFILQQLISNEYADKNSSKQNIYHMFMYMRRYLKHIRPAVDRFLEEYPLDPYNKEKAFKSFAQIIGTAEAESLAEILYQVEMTSPERVQDLLQKRYEELKKKRQEAYRSAMNDRGTIAYTLTFSGMMMVIICGLFVYYLEYKDMMNATYNFGQ